MPTTTTAPAGGEQRRGLGDRLGAPTVTKAESTPRPSVSVAELGGGARPGKHAVGRAEVARRRRACSAARSTATIRGGAGERRALDRVQPDAAGADHRDAWRRGASGRC